MECHRPVKVLVSMNQLSEFSLFQKNAWITGGASGIGRAIALCFARHGADVQIIDVDEKEAAETKRLICEAGGNACVHRCDVGDAANVGQVLVALGEEMAPAILVNSAGVAHVGRLDDTLDADFDRVYRVNVLGTHHAMRAAIGPMLVRGGGVILNIASIAASAGLEERYAYSMSKGAVLSMTYSVARDYLHSNVRCNAISPARVHTPFVDGFVRKNYAGQEEEAMRRLSSLQPIGRMATPEEVATLALYLCSDQASFITGADYPLDGGFFNLHG
jgi:NAD(P)-dependent dehydrogenase (short-subunit alcohol dehydrogenase family)